MSTTKTNTNVEKATQEVQLVEGLFTPSEAKDIVNKIIEDQANFYKLQHLSHWIGNNHTAYIDTVNSSKKLDDCKCESTELIEEANAKGCKVRLSAEFNISIED